MSKYVLNLSYACIPFSLGTLLLIASVSVKEYSKRLSTYSKLVGIIVSLLSAFVVIDNVLNIIFNIF